MMRFVIPICLTLATITKAIHYQQPYYSAASEAQIRFAIENKYDDTGPGAKEPEYAYNTYKTLEEALIGYLDDPDTKLPEHERNRAISSLVKSENNGEYRPNYKNEMFKRYYPKTVEEYTGYVPPKQPETLEVLSKPKPLEVFKGYRLPQTSLVLTKLTTNPPKKYYYSTQPQHKNYFVKQIVSERDIAEPYRVQKIRQPVRQSSLGLRQYNRDADFKNAQDQYDPHPKYTFSYGVHVPETGDTKSAQETREGGNVRGYYSFVDPDGKQRTVHYTANDQDGFRATIDRE